MRHTGGTQQQDQDLVTTTTKTTTTTTTTIIKELQKNSHIGHCTHTTKNANVKVKKHISLAKKTLHVAQIENTELYTLETWFVSDI